MEGSEAEGWELAEAAGVLTAHRIAGVLHAKGHRRAARLVRRLYHLPKRPQERGELDGGGYGYLDHPDAPELEVAW